VDRRHDHVLRLALPLVFVSVLTSETSAAEVAPETTTPPAVESAEATAHAIIGPVLTTDGANAKGDKEIPLRKITTADALALPAREIEAALRDAAQDLGLSVDLGNPLAGDGARDAALIQTAASGTWAISPRLEAAGSDTVILRMVAVPPRSTTMLVRFEKVETKHVTARAVVMLRDFVQMKLAGPKAPTTTDEGSARADEDEGRRSRGRPVLAASSTLFGLYTAFAIHSVAGGEDPRLLYPLLALGSGIGLGASLLAADEWNVTTGSAWTIAAGSWWGVIAGLNWAAGRDVRPVRNRYGYGLAAGLVGTTVAVAWTAAFKFDDGDATLVHSGAALGTFTGGVADLLIRGTLQESPGTGAGIGAAAGFLGGGIMAAFLQTTAQRVMLVDLGAGLDALGGPSLASPLVFRNETPGRARLFLGSVLAGTALGGSIAWFATRNSKPEKTASVRLFPTAGTVGTPELPGYSAGIGGIF